MDDKTAVRASKGFYGCIAEIGLKRGWWRDETEFWRLYDEIEFRKRKAASTASNVS